jgi:hypothetical protein
MSLALLTGCKDEKATVELPVEEKVSNLVEVTLTVTVQNDDNFQLYYKEEDNAEIPFEEQNSVWAEVKGNENPQEVKFILPESVLPNYLRLDVGTNPVNENMKIDNLKIEYLEKVININSIAFFDKYFISNENIVIGEKEKGTFKTKKENNNYDPLFFSEEGLKLELQKFMQ